MNQLFNIFLTFKKIDPQKYFLNLKLQIFPKKNLKKNLLRFKE